MGLEVDAVTVRFGGHTALDAVTLDAPDRSITGLIGPNGAGKTTLFNVITGVQRTAGGHVRLDGEALDRVPAHRRARRGLGRTFQRLELFGSLTVQENLRVAASDRPRRARAPAVDAVLERLGLGPVAAVRSDALSTGTGRLVELGRALVREPRCLLLDEPASGQDDEETERFAAVLRDLADDMTVVLVEHDVELVVSVCDRVHVLDFGRLLASGTPDEVRVDPAVVAAYLGGETTT